MDAVADLIARYSPGNALSLTRSFNAASLPVPGPGAYLHSEDSGLLAFLDEEACALRLITPALVPPNAFTLAADPDILRPLGVRQIAPGLMLEIMPGIKATTEKEKRQPVIDRLNQKFFVYDGTATYKRNIGELPDGRAVVLDRGMVRTKDGSPEAAPYGDDGFDRLRALLDDAWPVTASLPDPEKMTAFWEACRQAKRDGLLVDGWNHVDTEICYNIDTIRSVAGAYAAQRRHNL
ncbi:MAG: hypothetical protein H6867_08985 [Rhodospirillales bacterium]|nr:hypothetical protein [Rhodospirillales bacterium]MCB9996060.1 hypothetical protein [Rhodospirillales bacterium]